MSAKGGITEGNSHAEGGIPMVVKSTGQHVELEGGEGVVNKRNMASTQKFEFEGKEMTICEIASAINSANGNGVKIDCSNITGKKYKYKDGGGISRRTLAYGDAVLYKNQTWYISKQNGVVGIVFLGSGAWGSSYPFIPLNKIDVENQLTDMGGNKITIEEFAKGGNLKSTLSIEDYDTAEMSLGGYDEQFTSVQMANAGVGTPFKNGGDINIPHESKMFHLPLEIAVYVPSTSDVDNVISESELNDRVKEVSVYLSSIFGGYTSSEKVGGYMASNKELVIEDVVPVTSFATRGDFEKNKEKLVQKMSEWAREWGQEAIGFEIEGDLYYVPQKFAKGGDIEEGVRVEMEHKDTINKFKRRDISTRDVARGIAKDHLKEDKDYYKKLNLIENSDLVDIFLEHDKNLHLKKHATKRKFALGGDTSYAPHMVDVVFAHDHRAEIFTNEGKYDGDTIFHKDKLYSLEFLNNKGSESAFQFPLTNKYVIVPNEVVTIRGYDTKYAGGGNVPSPYSNYRGVISEMDIEILNLLRSANQEMVTIKEKEMISSFRGVNLANNLSVEIISKIYSVMFQRHNPELPIHKLWINNVGIGTMLNLAPIYIQHIKVSFDNNVFSKKEEDICYILNYQNINKQWSILATDVYEDADALMYCYPTINPTHDLLSPIVMKMKEKSMGIAICEFTDKKHLDDFARYVEANAPSKGKFNYVMVSKGITEKGSCSLIYSFTK